MSDATRSFRLGTPALAFEIPEGWRVLRTRITREVADLTAIHEVCGIRLGRIGITVEASTPPRRLDLPARLAQRIDDLRFLGFKIEEATYREIPFRPPFVHAIVSAPRASYGDQTLEAICLTLATDRHFVDLDLVTPTPDPDPTIWVLNRRAFAIVSRTVDPFAPSQRDHP